MPCPFLIMIYLQANTSGQVRRATWGEARKWLPVFTHYLIVIRGSDYESHACVVNVTAENARYSTFIIGTDQVSAGSVLISRSGQYQYRVYGQNSASNLDPTAAVVVGVVETGVIVVGDSTQYFDVNTPPTPSDFIYYE